MSKLDDILDAVTQQTTVVQSVTTLLQQLHQELQDALANGDVTKAQQVLDQLKANTQQLSEAVTANTETPPAQPTA